MLTQFLLQKDEANLISEAREGPNGKFYCGKELDGPKCSCCNGFCGPTNGCNCSNCMKLDVSSKDLPKGTLLNSDGGITSYLIICDNFVR